MTVITVARPRVDSTPRQAVAALARIEAGRMLRHPAPWAGLALTVWFAAGVFDQTWASAHYEGLVSSLAPLYLGVSLASVSTFARERTPVSDEAPLDPARRSVARVLGGLSLVAVVTVVVGLAVIWLRVRGGVFMGDEPGRTAHAYYTPAELLQPPLIAAFAIGLGAATVHLLRHRLVAAIVLFGYWFLVGGASWLFQGGAVRWLTPVQVQPVAVNVGPASTDPTTFPATWLLSAPGQYQPEWQRLIVSPALAGWHDVYLVALTLLTVAVAVPGRTRRVLAVAGLVLGAVAVLLQQVVTP